MSSNRNFKQQAGKAIWIGMWLAGTMGAQTKVDLGQQAKSVDLSASGPTKPVQVGVTVPPTCTAGQLFFKSDTIPGANLHGCVSTNTWVVISGPGGGGLGQMGVSVGGNLPVYLDNSGTVLVDSGVSGSAAVLMTQPLYQEGTPLDCVGLGTDTGSAMNCLLTPTLNAYALHMPLRLTPAVPNPGGFTLNVDSIGIKAVKEADCQTDPAAGHFQPGQTYSLVYNGTVFCEMHAGGMRAAPPYERMGAEYYLPFGFQAKPGPTTGWSAVNFSGATFKTTGMGGAIAIQTPASRAGDSLNMQVQLRGATNTLVAAIASGAVSEATLPAACGVGIHNSGSAATYGLLQRMKDSGAPVREAGYSSATAQAFTGNEVHGGVGGVVFLKVEIFGAQVISSYSVTGGPDSWVTINTRTLGTGGMPASVDRWAMIAESSGSAPALCQVLSWNVE